MDRVNERSPVSLPADRVICPDSVDRALLAVAAPGRDDDGWWRVPTLGRRGDLAPDLRRVVLANEACAEALSAGSAGEIDAEAVAGWITGCYRDDSYPAVVLGSPHGGAVHLAVALGAAWLPTSFPISLRWPGGSAGDWTAAKNWGAELAAGIVAGNPSVTVRQVHDPVLRGPLAARTVTLRLQWRRLPAAYTAFLRTRLRPGGSSLLLRDMRAWPVQATGLGVGFQIGSPVAGWSPEDYREDQPSFRQLLDALDVGSWAPPPFDAQPRYAEIAGDPAIGPELRDLAASCGHAAYRVLYNSPETLSACLADLFREQLGRTAACLVETSRLLDPRGAAARGLAPYWCETASRRAVVGAEMWLAGSDAFDEITVLPQGPGTDCEAHADLPHWRSLASFAERIGRVDRLAATRYPLLPVSTRHAAQVVGTCGEPRPDPERLTVERVVGALRASSGGSGLLVG